MGAVLAGYLGYLINGAWAEGIAFNEFMDRFNEVCAVPFAKAVKYYEKLKDKGENVYIDSLTYEQFMMLGDAELSRRFSMQDEAEQKAKIDREQANELEYVDESQKSDASESANASSGSAGAKPVRNPEREKPKWEDTAGYLMDGDEMGFDADVMLLAMMLQEMKNEDVRKVTIEQVKVLARLNKEA